MNKKTLISIATSTLITTLAVVGVTYAATPASNNTSLLNQGTVEVDSLKVGKQGSGGVTFFNGSIINNTTNNGAGVPITFADDVRIDGRTWRGETRGPGDNKPFVIEDDAQVDGALTVGGADVFAAIGAKGDKTAVDANTVSVAAKANSADVYSKAEVDSKDAAKANSSDVYSRSEVDSKDAAKANSSDVVLKSSPSWSAQTRYYSVAPSEINRLTNGQEITFGTVGFYQANSGFGSRYRAPVHLPHGAVVTNLKGLIKDTDGSRNLDIELYKTSTSSNTATLVSTLSSSGSAGTSVYNIAVANELIDNNANAYILEYNFNSASTSDLEAAEVVITYTITTP